MEDGRPIRTAERCGGQMECAAEREGLTVFFSPLPLAEAGAPARPPHCEAALRQYVGVRMVMNRVSPKSPRPRATPPVYRAMSLTEALCPPTYSSASRCSPASVHGSRRSTPPLHDRVRPHAPDESKTSLAIRRPLRTPRKPSSSLCRCRLHRFSVSARVG